MIQRPSDKTPHSAETAANRSLSPRALRRALRFTHLGLICETFWRALWPLFSVVMAGLAFVFLGGFSTGSALVFWASVGIGTQLVSWPLCSMRCPGCVGHPDPRRSNGLMLRCRGNR